MTLDREEVKERIRIVDERIANAATRSSRRKEDVKLLVVTKGHPIETVKTAILAGAKFLGENYPEESISKIKTLSHRNDIEWHMIGHLQSRKIPLVLENFVCTHSLDRLSIAEKMDQNLKEQGRTFPAMLEFNVGGEESKGGFSGWNESVLEQSFEEVEGILSLRNLRVIGLMTMPPFNNQPERSRQYFRRLREISEILMAKFTGLKIKELSMGTSIDFEQAIEEGATYVRIGEAIFGPRPSKN